MIRILWTNTTSFENNPIAKQELASTSENSRSEQRREAPPPIFWFYVLVKTGVAIDNPNNPSRWRMMNDIGKYRFVCTLTLSDILGQVIVWLGVIFAALASALSLMSKPIYSFGAVGLIVVTSLPFLLFTFVTTLFNHIDIVPLTEEEIKSNQSKISGVRKTAVKV